VRVPVSYSSVAHHITLESTAVATGTDVVVLGRGTTSVRLCVNYYLKNHKISTSAVIQSHNVSSNKTMFIIKMYIKFGVIRIFVLKMQKKRRLQKK